MECHGSLTYVTGIIALTCEGVREKATRSQRRGPSKAFKLQHLHRLSAGISPAAKGLLPPLSWPYPSYPSHHVLGFP
jgi:hypothetical protein